MSEPITREVLIQKLRTRGFRSYNDITRETATSFFIKVCPEALLLTSDGKRQQILVHIYGRLVGAIRQEPCVVLQITGDNILPNGASASVELSLLTWEEVYDGQKYTHAARRLMAAWRVMVASMEEEHNDLDSDPDADTNGPIAGGPW